MRLTSLEISDVRNLQRISLLPHHSTNFIIGPNGSGKTSFLEAISLLSSGRSFRAADSKKLIKHGMSEFVVFGAVNSERNGNSRIGFSRDLSGTTTARVDGKTQNKVSTLAKLVPTISIDTTSIDLIEGGPSLRRGLLDWGMFHVEHSFLEVWSQYRNALKQKNALLKSGKVVSRNDVRHWNSVLSRYGDRLHTERLNYSELLCQQLKRILEHYFNVTNVIAFRYRSGWPTEAQGDFSYILEAKIETEIERRSCLYGPHRADLDILWDQTLAKDICSRGQKKLVLYGVRLAQIALMIERIGVAPILLLDDLPAELDQKNIKNVIRFLKEFPCQSFITAINDQSISSDILDSLEEYKMFHVEHGNFTEAP